jgi:hypothetical protein
MIRTCKETGENASLKDGKWPCGELFLGVEIQPLVENDNEGNPLDSVFSIVINREDASGERAKPPRHSLRR